MEDERQTSPPSMASAIGGLAGLITSELGAAVAVIGGLYTGFRTLKAAERLPMPSWGWSLYLIAGGIFVAIAAVCRWKR